MRNIIDSSKVNNYLKMQSEEWNNGLISKEEMEAARALPRIYDNATVMLSKRRR